MNLKNDKLIIRNATSEDAKQLMNWWNDGRLMEHAGFPNGLGISEEEIIESLKRDSDDRGRRLIIEFDGKRIGEMSYRRLEEFSAEIGIKLCEASFQERGLGKKALTLLIRELFDTGFKKIVLDTNLNNKRAQHVYEELGFTKVKIRIDDWKDQLGRLQSAVDYELTEGDFIGF